MTRRHAPTASGRPSNVTTDRLGGRCCHHDGPHRDDPGEHCTGTTTAYRTSGDYSVPVCDTHATGPGLWKLGRLFYGWDPSPSDRAAEAIRRNGYVILERPGRAGRTLADADRAFRDARLCEMSQS